MSRSAPRAPDYLEPAFLRPTAIEGWLDLPVSDRFDRDDICALRGTDGPNRFFIRCLLHVMMRDDDLHHWGIWAEVSEDAFGQAQELWEGSDTKREVRVAGTLANRVRDYPDTVGLPVEVRLTSDHAMRPRTRFTGKFDHPFVRDCIEGLTREEADRWMIRRRARDANESSKKAGSADRLAWWWLSFADPDLPEGSRFLGAAIVRARSGDDALRATHVFGLNPGGEVMGQAIPAGIDVDGVAYRLLSADDCAAFERRAQGTG